MTQEEIRQQALALQTLHKNDDADTFVGRVTAHECYNNLLRPCGYCAFFEDTEQLDNRGRPVKACAMKEYGRLACFAIHRKDKASVFFMPAMQEQ